MSPVLSIITPTYNAEPLLARYFNSLKLQSIRRSDVEILIVDGGSTDRTRQIARKHGAKIIDNPQKLAEPGVALGFKHAKGSLVMVLATDNIFKDSDSLARMIGIFKDKSIVAAFPKHDTAPGDSMYSRYFNTFTDPYSHFVYGRAANARTFHEVYRTIQHTDVYDIYDFQSSSVFPLLALAQGFTVRKKSLWKRTTDRYDDVLIVYSLIRRKRRIAYAHSISLYHYTVANFKDFVKKQRRAVENALVRRNSGISQRRKYLTRWQKMKRFLFFPYALTIVFSLLVSVIQVIRTSDKTWMWHWYMSFVSAIILILTTLIVYRVK